jgi:hypothetical protein
LIPDERRASAIKRLEICEIFPGKLMREIMLK